MPAPVDDEPETPEVDSDEEDDDDEWEDEDDDDWEDEDEDDENLDEEEDVEHADDSDPREHFCPNAFDEPRTCGSDIGLERGRALALDLRRSGHLKLTGFEAAEDAAVIFASVSTMPAETLALRLCGALEGRTTCVLSADEALVEAALERTRPYERVAVWLAGEREPFATLEVPWRLSGKAEVTRVEQHPDGRTVALRLPIATGIGWASGVWDRPTGRLLFHVEEAVDVRFGDGGALVFALCPQALHRYTWPELRRRGALASHRQPGAYADRMTVEPVGESPSIGVLWYSPTDDLWGADIVRGSETRCSANLGSCSPADLVFSPDGKRLVTALADRRWWEAPSNGMPRGCGSLVLLGVERSIYSGQVIFVDVPDGWMPPDPTRAEQMAPLYFVDDATLVLVTPLGERRMLDWLEVVGPEPLQLPAPADVFAYVGPGHVTAADGPPPAPGDHGLRRWLIRGEELLVHCAGSLERRRVTDGAVLGRAFLPHVPGFPVDIAVSPSGTTAAVSWCDPDLGSYGYQLVDLRSMRALFNGGWRRDAESPAASRWVMRGPVWAPGGRMLVSSWGVAGWWLDYRTRGVATSGFKFMGEVMVHDIETDRTSSEGVTGEIPAGWTLDPAEDPDAVTAARFDGDDAFTVRAPHGETRTLSLARTAPTIDRGRAARRMRTDRPDGPEVAGRRVRVVTRFGDVVGDFDVPLPESAGECLTASGIAQTPAEDLIAMRLEGEGGSQVAGVWDTRSGALIEVVPGAIAFAFGERGEGGAHGGGVHRNIELTTCLGERVTTRFWPSRESRGTVELSLPGRPVALAVSRFDARAKGVARALVRWSTRIAVGWEARNDFRAGVWVRGEGGEMASYETQLRDPSVLHCRYTPDQSKLVVVFRENAAGKGPCGELVVVDAETGAIHMELISSIRLGVVLGRPWLAAARTLVIGGLERPIELCDRPTEEPEAVVS